MSPARPVNALQITEATWKETFVDKQMVVEGLNRETVARRVFSTAVNDGAPLTSEMPRGLYRKLCNSAARVKNRRFLQRIAWR